jgi:hypothetical protein
MEINSSKKIGLINLRENGALRTQTSNKTHHKKKKKKKSWKQEILKW